MLGEKLAGCIFLALAVIWWMLFLAPFRLPRFYAGRVSIVVLGALLSIVASCQALRSQSEGRRPGHWVWLFGTLPLAVIALICFHAILLRAGGFRAFRVPSSSMERTIQNGDVLMADMHFYRHHPLRTKTSSS